MNTVSYIVLAIIVSAVIAAAVYAKKKKIYKSCSGQCAGCPHKGKCK